ncbi:hypothetical protein WOLCODRAFT_160462 [Wolfiporia cocos MD-104 SS10]|uniref:Methyltransferase domain-containing protein n=1 Tax=Wolfiporia cocos (strain MD-104) TaxID=742152 RepID=A0A2H3IVB4_WOLCO|nr:hypothetical protein WOLCODRAFT_160462 [Wolfiporia cocos MD-104 SS10]
MSASAHHSPRPSYAPPPVPTAPDERSPNGKPPAREDKWIVQYGSRLHSYGRDKAPYPISYNKQDLELGPLDQYVIRYIKQGMCTTIDWHGKPPKRVLDVGCGLGVWIVDAAKEWPDSTFVGFDLMNVQIPLHMLPSDIASRIQWVHGNMQQLPFEDEEFDCVHICGLALGVPENKWPSVYEEIRRVMKTGATIEEIEEDAIFPVLPRWFTEPLHAHTQGPYMHFPDGPPMSPAPRSPVFEGEHEHALLESLFHAVFENRFINPLPSATLPSYFSAHFGHVLAPPVLSIPMPPLAPLQPPPSELNAPPPLLFLADLEGREKGEEIPFLPPVNVNGFMNLSVPTDSSGSTRSSADGSSQRSSASYDGAQPQRPQRTASISSTVSTAGSDVRVPSPSRSPGARALVPSAELRRKDSSAIGDDTTTRELFSIDNLLALEERALNMHLLRALMLVLSVREAMWDELLARMRAGDERLCQHGFAEEHFSAEAAARAKFDALVERYEKDVRARVSLWHSMVLNGWDLPRRDPMSRAEMVEEERLRQDIIAARRAAKDEDLQGFCRSARLMIGVKVRIEHLS